MNEEFDHRYATKYTIKLHKPSQLIYFTLISPHKAVDHMQMNKFLLEKVNRESTVLQT